MTTEPTTPQSKEDAKIKRGKRQAARVILQLFPMIIGLVGLYFISSWSLKMRLDFPGSDVVPYYIGLALILLALQLPVILEANRRKTKKLSLRQVVASMIALIILLVTMAAILAPQLDYDTITRLERAEWDLMHGESDDDDGKNAAERALQELIDD